MKITLLDYYISDEFDEKYIQYTFRFSLNYNTKRIESINLVIPKKNDIIKSFVAYIFKWYKCTHNTLYYKNYKYNINNDKIINKIRMY